jgi:hypothetical protein
MTRAATLLAVLTIAVTASAQTVAEKKQRQRVDDTIAKAATDFKDCGKTYRFTFDWKAFDGQDWKKIGRDKNDYYGAEVSNLQEIGKGLDRLCADKDYKAALQKVDTVVYHSSSDDKIRVKMTVSGSTLNVENYSIGGSTRFADDYEAAAKASL